MTKENIWKLALIVGLTNLFVSMPEMAAASESAISGALCRVANALTGKIGRGIATIGVVMLGIGLFLGKLSWGLAVAVGIGIAGIFGATTIVNWMSGGNSTASC